jgi:hypothetical protein
MKFSDPGLLGFLFDIGLFGGLLFDLIVFLFLFLLFVEVDGSVVE